MCFLEIITKTAINRGVHEKKGKKKTYVKIKREAKSPQIRSKI
jgi:hypothetical protein